MKKLLTLVLAFVLALAMSVNVFAGEANTQGIVLDPTSTDDSSTTAKVDVIISGSENLETVYSVVVTWDSLDFTYNFGEADVWDPDEHNYSSNGAGTEGRWSNNSSVITVTNHSNAAIRAKASFAGEAQSLTRNDVTASISNPSFTVASAVGLAVTAAPKGTFTCTVSGVPSVTSDFNIGTITITIETVTQ